MLQNILEKKFLQNDQTAVFNRITNQEAKPDA
jgi:hypothetical protein